MPRPSRQSGGILARIRSLSRLDQELRLITSLVTAAFLGACSAPSPATEDLSPSTTEESSTGSSAGPDLCAGLVTDKKVRAVPKMAQPPLLTPVEDPAFGSRIIRITDSKDKEVIKPMYSTIQAWNADESLLILWNRGRGHQLFDGRTYAHLRDLPLESPTDIEHVFWDPIDPDVLYYPSNYEAAPRLMRYRVSQKKNDTVRDFRGEPTNCPVSWGALLSAGGDPMDMSWGPERVIGLACGETKFLYSIAEDRVLAKIEDPGPMAPVVTYDGKLALMYGRVLDTKLEVQRELKLVNSYEHASLGRGAAGPLYGAADYDGRPPGNLVVHDIQTGRKTPIIAQSNGWPYPPSGTHISGVARSGPPGWFALSVMGDPNETCLLCQELLLANADTGTVCRVAHHRSWSKMGRWGYWAEPHVVLSPTGTRLLFASDWGNGMAVNTYVVELRAYESSRRESPSP